MPSCVLVENAALAFVSALALSKKSSIRVVCGKGNNGADGFAIARQLRNSGYEDVVCHQVWPDLGAECQAQKERAVAYGVDVRPMEELDKGASLVVDAIYGTGYRPPLDQVALKALRMLEGHPNIVSVDVPSGLSDRAPADGPAVRASLTVTFGALKPCLLSPYAASKTGALLPLVRNPGLPAALLDGPSEGEGMFLIDAGDSSLGPVDPTSYKNRRGHVACFLGRASQRGAAILAGLAAFRARAGLVTILGEPGSGGFGGFPQLMSGSRDESLERFDALCLGNGLDPDDPLSLALLRRVLASGRPLVLDSGAVRLWRRARAAGSAPLVMTPHLGELKALLGVEEPGALSTDDLAALLRRTAREAGAVLVVKGSLTWIVLPDGGIRVLWGKMAQLGVAGSGDVLAGIIAAFLGAGMDAESAAVNGVLVHYEAGKLARAAGGWYDSACLASQVGKAVESLGGGAAK